MPQILKDTQVVSDNWMLVDENAESLPTGDLLLSLEQWQNFADHLSNHSGSIGVWLEGHAEIEQIIEPLLDLPLIAINFPKFADGRGFSAARLRREREKSRKKKEIKKKGDLESPSPNIASKSTSATHTTKL